jgi:hypothetical protein
MSQLTDRRILVTESYPDGRNLAARTSIYRAADDKAEITALWRAAAARATGTDHQIPDVTEHCDLDRAQRLAEAVFTEVRRIDLAGEVRVPDPAPVLAFLDSQRSFTGRGLPVDEVLAAAAELVADTIGTVGAYRFGTHVGILACR